MGIKRTLLGIVCLACTALTVAAELHSGKYTVYRGDTNGDTFEDLYLYRGPDYVPMGTDVLVVIPREIAESYLLTGNADGTYNAPVLNNSIDPASLTEVTDISYGDVDGDGNRDVLIQGQSVSDQSIVVRGTSTDPVIWSQFTQVGGVDIAASEGTLTLESLDSDEFDDLVFSPIDGTDRSFQNDGTGSFGFSLAQITRYTYYNDPRLLKSVDGPRTDVVDLTQYIYDVNYELHQTINALGHVTEIVSRDPRGMPTEVEDPNGISTHYTYTPRGWIDTIRMEHPTTPSLDAITDYDYYPTGLIERITLPDGSFTEYEYDAAQRLEAIENALGERLEFSLDAAGNPTMTLTRDAGGSIVQELEQQFDELSRLYRLYDNQAAITTTYTEYDYDLAGNPTEATDALSRLTQTFYDELNRVDYIIDADGNTIDFDYDAMDNLTEVVDQRGVTTTYEYDRFQNLTREISADRGTIDYEYDMGNNLVKMTDARGVVVEYSYDALNRLTNIHYPADSTKDVTYAYDQGTYGIGRLSSITDESGQITYSYDHRGNINQETRVIDGVSYITNYTYDLADNLATMTYPSGRVVDYSDRDVAGQLNGIDEGSNTVIELVDHQPFRRPADWTYGNGVAQSMVVDLDGRYESRLLDSTGGVLESWTYDYSVVGNLEEIDKGANSELYEYDVLDRLWRQTPIGESQIEYGYDAGSNRLTETQSGSTITNTYASNSNRMLTQDGASVVHDASGNITDVGSIEYEYDERGRLVFIEDTTVLATLEYNTLGQRVQKTSSGSTTDYVYDLNGQLIGEYDDGVLIREYVYFQGLPVAQIEGGQTIFLHPDHLGSPRTGTDSSETVVWSWAGEAFGSALSDEDPDGDSTDTEVNLRFPGQYYDDETGLHYNYFRHYDPLTGRYMTSDPIGLAGGVNTYAYVGGNPVGNTDPTGLVTLSLGGEGSFQSGAAGGSISGLAGIDSSGNVCFQVTICGRLGPGEAAGIAYEGEIGQGEFCEGDSVTGGFFAEGGYGVFGGLEVNTGADDVQGSVQLRAGIGGGAAGGSQICLTRTICPFR